MHQPAPQLRRRRWSARRLLKKFARTPFAIGLVGRALAGYLRLVRATSRFTIDPPDLYEKVEPGLPVIVAMWHGQHFMAPFIRKPHHRAAVLISKSADGEMNAIAAERLGMATIRGSGSNNRKHLLFKRGAAAFRDMLRALEDGITVALTADVPKGPARRAGLGIIMLARQSGRPIYPAAVATSRRVQMNSWDKASVNLPFSRGAITTSDPLTVPADADDAAMERCRQQLEDALNAATERAYAIVDGRRG